MKITTTNNHWYPGPMKWYASTEIGGGLGFVFVVHWGWTERQAVARLERAIENDVLADESDDWTPDDCADLLENS